MKGSQPLREEHFPEERGKDGPVRVPNAAQINRGGRAGTVGSNRGQTLSRGLSSSSRNTGSLIPSPPQD